MKKKSLKLRPPYFFGQRTHRSGSSGNMPELIKPESRLQTAESGVKDILRWADDGGKMLDLGNLTSQPQNPDAPWEWSNKSE